MKDIAQATTERRTRSTQRLAAVPPIIVKSRRRSKLLKRAVCRTSPHSSYVIELLFASAESDSDALRATCRDMISETRAIEKRLACV